MAGSKEDIKAMLAKVNSELSGIDKRRDILLQRKATLEAWLAEEEPGQQELNMPGGAATQTPLSGFVKGVLSDGRPRVLPEIVQLVEAKGGLVREHTIAGRAVHGALIGLSKAGDVKRNADGAWVIRKGH